MVECEMDINEMKDTLCDSIRSGDWEDVETYAKALYGDRVTWDSMKGKFVVYPE